MRPAFSVTWRQSIDKWSNLVKTSVLMYSDAESNQKRG